MKSRVWKFASIIVGVAVLLPQLPTSNAATESRGYFALGDTSSINLAHDYPGTPLTDFIDERKGVYPEGWSKSTGANISIRSIFGWGLAVSALGNDNSSYDAAFPPCGSSQQSDCISKVYVVLENGKIDYAVPLKEMAPNAYEYGNGVPAGIHTFPADSKLNRPAGGNLWVWKFNSFKHRGGSLLIPSVMFEGISKSSDGQRFNAPLVRVGMYPVAASSETSCIFNSKGGCDGYRTVAGIIKSDKDYSLLSDKLEGQEKLGIEFRSSVPWTLWSSSTIRNLNFKHSKSGTDYVYEISGQPGVVPEVATNVDITQSNYSLLKKIAGDNLRCDDVVTLKNCSTGIFLGGKDGAGSNPENFKTIESLESLTSGKSAVAIQHWLIQTNLNSTSFASLPCAQSYKGTQPIGISTSNATVAQDSPPTWDSADSSFSYKVAAFHSLPDGQPFKGFYSLSIPKDVATCLWPGDVTKAKLQLSIINSDGSSDVTTTTAGISENFFLFNAANFHFSSPVLKAKVTFNAKVEPKEVKTITCIKGKTSKKVQGVNPKCPSGYRQK